MKKSIIISLLIVVMSIFGAKVFAYDIAVENADGVTIYYNYINEGKELEVAFNDYGYSGNVVIPEEVIYMNRIRKVTSIGESSFTYCSDLISVTIPSSVTTIHGNAFMNCVGLTSVHISNISAWCNILFCDNFSNPLSWAHHLFMNGIEIKDLIIPNNVTDISDRAFSGCSGLASVYIPNSVISIGKSAFSFCSGLTSVVFPNSMKSIGDAAFSGCSGLTSVIIPNSVISIGIGAFDYSDIPTIVSLIENPYKIDGSTFSKNTFFNATLYVPAGTIDKYKQTEGWKDFVYIEEGTAPSGETSGYEQCAKPTISYKNGKLTFNCDTEGAVCQSTITDADIKSYSSNEVQLGVTYNISVYATKSGYQNSETVIATLCWIDVDPKTEGIENSIASVRAKAVLIQGNDGVLSISGVDDSTNISVYSVSGQIIGSAMSSGNQTSLVTNLRKGEIAIVKIGEKSVKVVMQ